MGAGGSACVPGDRAQGVWVRVQKASGTARTERGDG